MRVIYQRPMIDQIIEATAEAREANQEIEHIELSRSEWDQLRGELHGLARLAQPAMIADRLGEAMVNGVRCVRR